MKKQILALLGVGTLAYGSANLTFTNTQALTAPLTYALGYFQNPVSADWVLTPKTGGTAIYNPGFARTGTSPNYDYNAGLGGTGWDNGDFPNTIPNGITINMRFNLSNTNWSAGGSGIYYPFGGGSIGSDNTVGAVSDKVYLEIDNQTNKDYYLLLDTDNTPASRNYFVTINDNYISNNDMNYFYYNEPTAFLTMYITAYSNFKIRTGFDASSFYIDAWYLQDMGFNSAYNTGLDDGYGVGYDDGLDDGYDVGYEQGEAVGLEQGYPTGYSDGFDDGFSDGLIIAPIGVLFQSAFGAVASIFNISVLGNLTLGSIIIAPIAVALLWFILGIVSGVGVGGKKK
jgi:hypothetical protein